MRNIRQIRFFLIVLLFLLVALLFYKALFIFTLIMILSIALQVVSYKGDIKFNFGHVFFLSILVQRGMGIAYSMLLLIFAGFLPKAFAGDIDLKSLATLPLEIVIVFLTSLFTQDIFIIGMVAAILNYSISFIVAKASGDSVPEILAEIGLPFMMNIVYLMSLAGPLETFIGFVTSV
ncbi:MAG: hypothetical protein NDI94_03400 [Candidatus Woesearchaeota archaeon]|nr:hypothetical protein [Candidatus Woesearchaeota archaeon]